MRRALLGRVNLYLALDKYTSSCTSLEKHQNHSFTREHTRHDAAQQSPGGRGGEGGGWMPVTLRASSSSQREGWVAQVVGMMSALHSCWRIQSQEVLACAYMHMRMRVFNTMQHTTTHYNALHYTTTHCDALQHTATHCITLHHTATHRNTLHPTAPYCNTLPHSATHAHRCMHACIHITRHFSHCNTLQQHTRTTHFNTLQHTTLHFSTLPHTATIHRNTVQHTPDAVDTSCLRIRT